MVHSTNIIDMNTMFADDDLLGTAALLLTQDTVLYKNGIPHTNLVVYSTILDSFFAEHMDDFRGWVLKAMLLKAERRLEEAQSSWNIACALCKNLLGTFLF